MRRTGAIMWWGPLVGCGTVEAPEVPAQEVGGLVATYDAGVVWLRRGATSEVGLSAVGPAVPPVRVGGRTEYRRQGVTEWWQAVPWGSSRGSTWRPLRTGSWSWSWR